MNLKIHLMTSLTLILVSGFVFSQTAPIKFNSKSQKFGKVEEGTMIELKYPFTNQGEKPILINESKVNCTCTKVTFTQTPIKPGEGGEVQVSFDTKGKIGYQERKIELKTNQGIATIVFKGTVKASEATKEQYKSAN